MKRRTVLGSAWVAGFMGAAGGVALWHRGERAHIATAAAWWASSFVQPGGGMLQPAQWQGRPLLLNFWAPWCRPCVQELPLLDQFYQRYRAQRWQVVAVAIDTERSVQAFLNQHSVSFPVALAGLEGIDLSRTLGNPSGALPFTVVFNSVGRVADRKLGILKPENLSHWAQRVS